MSGKGEKMHIPDGYLSPQTCAVGFAIAIPTIATASKRVTKTVKARNVPTLAVLAAVSFITMMFNIPIPDGTTAHAVGGVLIAILLGPWAAMIAVSVALLFQALLFGDGGVLAYGFNVTNMAIILPIVGYTVYKLIAGSSAITSRRRVIAAGIAGYAGINAAAFATAIELGVQPSLFHAADGTPLYAPYHLSKTIPAMMLAHITLAGAAELILSAGVVAYLQRANLPLLMINNDVKSSTAAEGSRKLSNPKVAAGIALVVAALLTPLGLLAPGGAFGEDAPADLNLSSLGLSTIPSGLKKWNEFWHHSIFDGYGVSGTSDKVGYILSAFVGIAVIGLTVFILFSIFNRFGNSAEKKESVR